MRKKNVWVEVDMDGDVVRVFKNRSAASRVTDLNNIVVQMEYTAAVKAVREAIVIRGHGFCELCGSPITKSNGHMHEQKHRGKGGEISLANSVFICSTCHATAHKDRNPRFSKKPLDI